MTLTSTGMLTFLDYQPLNIGTATPGDGEFFSTATPKIISNFAALFATGSLLTGRIPWAVKNGPSNSLTPINTGSGNTIGTAAGAITIALSSADQISMRRRAQFSTGATANTNAGYRSGADLGQRSSFAGAGGFVIRQRFGLRTLPSTTFRLFAGLSPSAVLTPTVDFSTLFSLFGVGKDAADTQLYLMYNGLSGTATKIALDPTLAPMIAGTALECTFACAPGANQPIAYRIRAMTGLDDEGNDTFGTAITGSILNSDAKLLPVDVATSQCMVINSAANASDHAIAIHSVDGVRF